MFQDNEKYSKTREACAHWRSKYQPGDFLAEQSRQSRIFDFERRKCKRSTNMADIFHKVKAGDDDKIENKSLQNAEVGKLFSFNRREHQEAITGNPKIMAQMLRHLYLLVGRLRW